VKSKKNITKVVKFSTKTLDMIDILHIKSFKVINLFHFKSVDVPKITV
jgi:hypothetical protein